jgi:hypothetical protein
MKIAIAASPLLDRAAHAAGLAAGLAAGKADVVVDPTRAAVRARGFQTLYEVPGDLQTQLRLGLLDAHATALAAPGDAVFDHCAVEWMADWMRWHWSAMPSRAWDAAMAKAKSLVARYDRIEHLVAGPARAYDGFVWLDGPAARQTEELMFFLYDRLGARVTKVG